MQKHTNYVPCGTKRIFGVDEKIAKFLNRVLTFARHNVIIFMPDKKE